MATPDFDISYHWTRGNVTGWTTIGYAFLEDDGRINIKMSASPLPGIQTNPGYFTLFPKIKAGGKKADKETPPGA